MLLYEWLSAASKKQGADKALVYRDTYVSWRGLSHRVDRRAMELVALGLGAGDWVGVMLGNIPEFVILALAIAKVGAVVAPLDPTLGSRELDLILAVAPLRGLITRPRGGESAAPGNVDERKGRRRIAPSNRRRLQGTLLTCSTYIVSPERRAKDVEVVLMTTDSAGDVKGVMRTRNELLALCDSAKKTLGFSAEDRVLAAEPMFQGYGFDMGFLLPLRYGATLFLEDELSDKRISKILREHRATFVPGTSAVYLPLCRQLTAQPLRTKGARFLSAGQHADVAIPGSFYDRYGVRLWGCYHTTETGPVTVDLRGKNSETVGRPFAGVEVRIGQGSVEAGSEGPIWVRSTAIAKQSLGARPAATAPGKEISVGCFDVEGWFRTGDVGKLDRGGRLILCGREDDVVKVEGRRVALGEVEACIESLGRVAAAQVAVERDALGGSFVVARVVTRGQIGAEEIIDHCAKNLAPYKVPRRVEFCQQIEASSPTLL